MAKIRVRKESNKLFIDFRYQGVRFREQTLLDDTSKNRKQLEAFLRRMESKMMLGEFDYEEFFPGSSNLQKLRSRSANNQDDSGEDTETTTPLFADFADQWLEETRVQWRKSHTRNVESILRSSLKPAFKEKQVSGITKADILAARGAMAKRKSKAGKGAMAPKTINSHMTILRMILTEASERFDFDNPYRNIKPLKLQKVHIEPFSLDEVDLIIKHVREDYRNYYQVRFYTGMRTGEIDGLKWPNVDFERREILVRETLVQGQTEYTKTNGSQREIPMFGPVYEALKQYAATGKLSKFVFCNRLGEPLEHNNVTKRVWYPLLEHLKLKKRRPYQTRHTAATLLLASGENPEWVARTPGHSSTEMLFKVYSRFIPNLTRMDGSAFERLIQSRVIVNDKELGDDDLRPILEETFKGTYRLTGRVACFDDEGIPYLKLRLSSCASDIVVLAVIGSMDIPERLGHMDLVAVKGQACIGSEESEVLLTEIRRPQPTDLAHLPALQTLPRTSCPKPEALDQLIAAVRSLELTSLQVFIKRVLERRGRLEVFLKAPASRKYHHNDPGGLLVHSLEVAQNVLRIVRINEPEMPQCLQEVGFVAGLLHDIGKTYTYDTRGKPTAAAQLCDHADLTLEACAYGLAYLDKSDPDAALALRHIWTCASPGARYGASPAMTLARYVRDADAQSAMLDNQRKAYQKRARTGFGRLGNNFYWRPSIKVHG